MTERQTNHQGQRGFGVIVALGILVFLSAMSAAIVTLSSASHITTAQDVLAIRATAAAQAGREWGLYQALKGTWTACSAASQTLDLRTQTGFQVTVSCQSTAYNEGEISPGLPKVVHTYRIEALACNSPTACPDNTMATSMAYIERKIQIVASN